MAHLIDKSALVAEIKRRKDICKKVVWDLRTQENKDYYQGKAEAYKETIDLLDTLEVKEVDLNEYINKHFKGWYVDLTDQGNILHTPDGNAGLMSVKEVAKHFFELGMSVNKK